MKELPDFDLSIVMPFYKRLAEFKRVFPSKAKYYERNGIEVVIVADEPTEEDGILDYIRTYPFSCKKGGAFPCQCVYFLCFRCLLRRK